MRGLLYKTEQVKLLQFFRQDWLPALPSIIRLPKKTKLDTNTLAYLNLTIVDEEKKIW